MDEMFKCNACSSTFYQKKYLAKHVKRMHSNEAEGPSVASTGINIKCSEDNCNEDFRYLHELGSHLEHTHNLEGINSCQKLTFPSKSEFSKWLADEEQKTSSKYFIAGSEKKCQDHTYAIFNCNRSGVFKSQAKINKKQLKAQGSVRIGHHCTSSIIKKEYDSHTEILYFSQHYKHDKELKYVPIPREDKQIIAGKLLEGVTDRRILTDCRIVHQEKVRKNLITSKDLYNIKKEFGINIKSHGSVVESDEESVHAWVQDMAKTSINPVLLYKRQDIEHPILPKKDFMLVMMNDFQKNMFREFGGDRISIDATHGISNYGFELVTLLIIDKFDEGIPVAFCIASTVNKKNLVEFFKCIKNIHFVCPKVFMSDDASMFYAAWQDVFGDCPYPLLCSWHVDRAWQGHTKTIKEDKRKDVYDTLKSLMYELDVDTFKNMLISFVTKLEEDDDTKAFAKYFVDNYCNRTEKWAYCYRVNARINTNMHLENFHRNLKHAYFDGKKIKRLDKTIAELNNLIRDKESEDIIKQYKGKITKKCTLNFKRHKEAENLNFSFKTLSDTKWEISSSEDKKTYVVTKKHSCNDKCIISCRECVICPLAYQCACHDNLIANTICKHIHYILLSINGKQNFVGPLNQSHMEDAEEKETNELTLLNYHEQNKQKMLSLSSQISLIPNMDENRAKQIRKHLNAIDHLLNIPTAQEQKLTVNEKTSEPSNKKITKQKRFHSTKKQRTAKKPRLSKQSAAEREVKKSILLSQEFISSDRNNDHSYC